MINQKDFMLKTEFEIKAYIDSQLQLKAILDNSTLINEQVVIDEYYDTQETSLFKSSVFYRIRNHNRLDLKFDKNSFDLSHTLCNEMNFKYPLSNEDNEKVDEFLYNILNIIQPDDTVNTYELTQFVVIDRVRKTFKKDNILIIYDKVKDLGDFIEIEGQESDAEHIKKLSQIFELKPLPIGYVELYLRKFNFPLYLQGKFLLSEDLSK